MVRERSAREADRVRRSSQVARDEGDVGRLDGDVRPGSEGETEICLRERRRVVDPVADHRDDLALVLQAPTSATLSAG